MTMIIGRRRFSRRRESWKRSFEKVLSRISQIASLALACDLRQTLEKQGYSASSCHAEGGTQWVTAKTRNCGLVLTAA